MVIQPSLEELRLAFEAGFQSIDDGTPSTPDSTLAWNHRASTDGKTYPAPARMMAGTAICQNAAGSRGEVKGFARHPRILVTPNESLAAAVQVATATRVCYPYRCNIVGVK